MESLEGLIQFNDIYRNKTVLITGHTGFKGSWLAFWLDRIGANIVGYSLEPNTIHNHFSLLNTNYKSIIGDINDLNSLKTVFNEIQPDVVFHLAAQALVRDSYEIPIETYKTNVIGTLNVYESAKSCESVKAIVNITSDKCYENREWIWGYRENDPMGGYDPYSSSKGCSELLTSSFRRSFFNSGNKLLASARAGNVIGGGDWAKDRLIPDLVHAASENNEVSIRSPKATRPWQHVLEPLSGYLTLGWKLLEGKLLFADGWNFGPELGNNISVLDVCRQSKEYWDNVNFKIEEDLADLHEANLLMLDCSKANKILKWRPIWGIKDTIRKTINWYKSFYMDNVVRTEEDLVEYIKKARELSATWVK